MDKKKNENFFLKLIKIKKEIRDCVQNGIYQRSFRKITSGRVCCYVGT